MRAAGWLSTLAVLAWAFDAGAGSPGFFVGRDASSVGGDSASVVIAHDGTRGVVTIQRDYRGPAAAFAFVVPVPASVSLGNVKVLPRGILQKLNQSTAPSLLDVWELNPCPTEEDQEEGVSRGAKSEEGSMGNPFVFRMLPRSVAGAFGPREMSLEMVSGDAATPIDAWLRSRGFHVPDGAHAALTPYLTKDHAFLVATIDPKKLPFDGDRAVLSPIRYVYDGPAMELPLAMGAIDGGVADIVVHVVTSQRAAVEGQDDVTPPVDLAIATPASRFEDYYRTVFETTIARHPGAFVTEYAGSTYGCLDCVGGSTPEADWKLLGFDSLTALTQSVAVTTRVHRRSARGEAGEDVKFHLVAPIGGGTKLINGSLDVHASVATASEGNGFHARYLDYHPNLGRSECSSPDHDSWGETATKHPSRNIPADGFASASPNIDLTKNTQSDVPSLGVVTRTAYTFDRWRPMRRGVVWGGAIGLLFAIVLTALRRRGAE